MALRAVARHHADDQPADHRHDERPQPELVTRGRDRRQREPAVERDVGAERDERAEHLRHQPGREGDEHGEPADEHHAPIDGAFARLPCSISSVGPQGRSDGQSYIRRTRQQLSRTHDVPRLRRGVSSKNIGPGSTRESIDSAIRWARPSARRCTSGSWLTAAMSGAARRAARAPAASLLGR